jgi:hypothetical protein
VKGGIRWEHTSSEGQWRSADSVTTRSYDDFFPTVFLGYNPAQQHNLSFSYTRRIHRPNYWLLNPFRRYISAYSFIEGNPELSPEYTHRMNLSYTGFQVLNTGVMYSFSNEQIIQIPSFDEATHASGYRQGNFGKTAQVAAWAGLSELPLTAWWTFSMNVAAGYLYNENGDYKKEAGFYQGYGSTTFLLGKTWKAEIEYNLQSPISWGYFNIQTQHTASVGVQKTLWNNKGSLSLYVDDVFGTQRNDLTTHMNGIDRDIRQHNSSRAVRASFSYRFGNAGKPAKQRNVGQQEESERLGGN